MLSRRPVYAAGCRLPFTFPFPEGTADAGGSAPQESW